MPTIGVDAHKSLRVAVAINAAGEQVGCWRGANSTAGWAELLAWAKRVGEARRFGVEVSWNDGRGSAQQLVAAGETVYEINARWTAEGRGRARKPGKSDDLDARAVAEVVRRHADTLPVVTADDDCAVPGALSVILGVLRAEERTSDAGGATASRGRSLPSQAAPGWL